jgi:hypothetical protein
MVAVVAAIGLGMVTPVRAHANTTGALLVGVAAGVLVSGLLNRDSDRQWGVDRRPEEVYHHRPYVPAWNSNDRATRDNRGAQWHR